MEFCVTENSGVADILGATRETTMKCLKGIMTCSSKTMIQLID